MYYADVFVRSSLKPAWQALLNYEAWNPTFVGAQVEPVRGIRGSEDELVLISKKVPGHAALPRFYAQTVKVIPGRRIVWYVHATDEQAYQGQKDAFRNFVDFGLTEESGGVRFSVAYYAQNRLAGDLLASERESMDPSLREMTAAFREHCETGQRFGG